MRYEDYEKSGGRAGSGGEQAERTDDIAAKHVCDDVLAYLFSVSRILKVNARKDTGINQYQLSANMPRTCTRSVALRSATCDRRPASALSNKKTTFVASKLMPI